MERRSAPEGRLETVTMCVVYLVREILFLSMESQKKALLWPSSFVSNSNPYIVGNKSSLEFKTELINLSELLLCLYLWLFHNFLPIVLQSQCCDRIVRTRLPCLSWQTPDNFSLQTLLKIRHLHLKRGDKFQAPEDMCSFSLGFLVISQGLSGVNLLKTNFEDLYRFWQKTIAQDN